MNNKLLSVFLVFLVAFLASTLTAAATNDYSITDVDINGVDIDDEAGEWDGTTIVDVKRGDSLFIDLEILGVNDVSSVRVKAEIEGYEYEDIEDKTGYFDVESNITYSKSLRLQIPDDIDAEDYALSIEVVSQDYTANFEATIRVRENRHDLNIYDVILRPNVVEAGKTLFAEVRVENLGAYSEEDVEVRISMPELGLMDRGYIDEISTELEEEEDDDNDLESSASTNGLFLRMPENTKTGNYELFVEVEYNRGHNLVSRTYMVSVDGKSEPTTSKVSTLISMDTTTQTIAQGEGAVYRAMFANLGDEAKTYSLEVTGTQLWANTRVDPAVVTVQSGESAEMYVYLSALSNAATGNQPFTVKVKEGTTTVKEVGMTANVVAASASSDTITWNQARRGLELGFVVLLVVLVVLGIILVIRKLRGSSETEEPGTAEGQSYYYYPNY